MQTTSRIGPWLMMTLVVGLAACNSPSGDTSSEKIEDGASVENREADTAGSVGTINIQRLFYLLGFQEMRAAKQIEMRQSMDAEREKKKAEVEAKLKELGGDREKLDDGQRRELAKLEAQCIQSLQKSSMQMRQVMSRDDAHLNNLFSIKTKEPIRKVAERRKLDVVLVAQANAFAYIRPGIDITDEVLAEIGTLPVPGAAHTPPAEPSPVRAKPLADERGAGKADGDPSDDPARAEPRPPEEDSGAKTAPAKQDSPPDSDAEGSGKESVKE